MSNISNELIEKLVSNKDYQQIQEFVSICHSGQKPLTFLEYTGTEVRAFEQDGNINIMCPEKMTPVQESALAKALQSGTIFDDAEEVSRGANYVRMIVIPARAFATSNPCDLPKSLTTLTKACIGTMDDQGRLPCDDAAISNGHTFEKDMLTAKDLNRSHADIARHHLSIPDSEMKMPMFLGKEVQNIKNALKSIKEINPEDSLRREDYDEIDPNEDYKDREDDDDEHETTEEDVMNALEDIKKTAEETQAESEAGEGPEDEDSDPDDDKDTSIDVEPADEETNPDDDEPETDEDEDDEDDKDEDEEDDDEEDSETAEEAIQEFVLATSKNIKKKMSKILKDTSDELDKLVALHDSDRLSRGKIVQMYGPTEHSYSTTTKVTDDYSLNMPHDYETKSKPMKLFYKCEKYCSEIIRKSKYSDKFTRSELSALDTVKKCLKEIIEDLEAIIKDVEGYDRLIKGIVKNCREVIEEVSATKRSFNSTTANAEEKPVAESFDYDQDDKEYNEDMYEEAFISKKPKKLKDLKARETITYITVELNNVRDSNDQALLSGYICSKLELVDFYINCLDTQDARYVVPHSRTYLVQFQSDLNRLLTQVLRIKPVRKQDRVWQVSVNYPEGWGGII